MKLTKAIETEVIQTIAGEDVTELVLYLKGKKNVSEFVIAEDLEKEINAVRNMLYRLLHAKLVSFTRKKDKQKGGRVGNTSVLNSRCAVMESCAWLGGSSGMMIVL